MSSIGTLSDPIIVIGSTSIVTKLSVLFQTSNTDEEDRLVLLTENILTFFGSGMGMFLDHIITRGKCNLLRKNGFDTKLLRQCLLGVVKGFVDCLDRLLKVLNVTVLCLNMFFPIKLIDIQ